MIADPAYKKRIDLPLRGRRLQFDVATDLFSSHAIDTGSRLLIRSLEGVIAADGPLLDLGCGYGPIGLSLCALTGREALLVDRDALAVDYAAANARLNGLDPMAEAAPGLGYDDLGRRRFALIASNIPAKAGAPVIRAFLEDAACFLLPGGRAAVVIIRPLAPLVGDALAGIAGARVIARNDAKHYSVFHYEPEPRDSAAFAPAFERGVYDRASMTYAVAADTAHIDTVWGLPEFDTLSYETEMLMASLAAADGPGGGTVVVLNPGQGHAAVAAWLRLRPDRLVLADRDLLALRAARRNLERNGCPAGAIVLDHAVRPGRDGAKADLILARPREEEGTPAVRAALDAALARLGDGGRMLVTCSSTAATRIAVSYRGSATKVAELRRERRTALIELTPTR